MLKYVKTRIKTKNKKYISIYSNIHEDFPRDILVEALKRYYQLYLNYTNSLNNYKSEIFKELFIKYIRAFFEYNKCFGRKIYFCKKK